MVERVEGFCTSSEWKRAYREINDMERSELSTVRFEEFNEQYQYLLLAALVLLLAEFLVLDRRNPLLAHLNIFREPERKEPGL